MKGYIFVMEKTFRRQKRFDCIPKLFVAHYPIWSNFGKVVLFRLFVKILTDILLLLKCQGFTRWPFRNLFLSLDLFIIALLSSFVIKGASLPLTIFFLYWSVFIKKGSKNICKDIILIMFLVIDRPFAKFVVKFVKKIIFVKVFIIPLFNIFRGSRIEYFANSFFPLYNKGME